MPRGIFLTAFEKGQILAYHNEKKSNRWIGEKIKRSETVVRNFLRSPNIYGTKKSPGSPKILQPRDVRKLNREA